MTEIWKDIKRYEGIYQVSNFGNIKRLFHSVPIKKYNDTIEHKRIYKEQNIKNSQDKDGYLIVSLKSKTYKVHRLVAIHFIDNSYHWPDVTHKNGNLEDNNVENLEWICYEKTEQEKK